MGSVSNRAYARSMRGEHLVLGSRVAKSKVAGARSRMFKKNKSKPAPVMSGENALGDTASGASQAVSGFEEPADGRWRGRVSADGSKGIGRPSACGHGSARSGKVRLVSGSRWNMTFASRRQMMPVNVRAVGASPW